MKYVKAVVEICKFESDDILQEELFEGDICSNLCKNSTENQKQDETTL